ncbi:NosD domain-containing protein, partial [Methanococcus maripaludis]
MIKKCLLLCLLLFALGSVNAVDINYDLEQSDFDSGAVAINSPGEYYLTGNIASPNGIEIYSDDVTLDGHGYSLTVTNSHGIQSGLHDNITIKNVVLNVTTSSSDRYSISFTGIMNSKILNNTVISNGNYAIYYYGSENTTISANTITAGYDGIYIGSSSENTTISGNTITAESDGIYVIGSSIVTGNKITSEYGIDVNGKSMVTGNTINVYDIGIDCDGSNSEITGNTITTTYEEGWGIEIETNNCTVLENTIYSNYSMDLDGYNLTVANNTLTSGIYFDSGIWTSEVSANTINGKPIYFYKNEENIGEIPSDAGQIIIINCTNGQISNLNLDEKAEVIYITNSSGITVENCTINPAIIEDYYIYIENSENCEFTKNTFNVSKSNVVGGIWAEDVNNITISENRFDGIYVALEGDYFTNSSVFNNIFENISPVPLAFEGNCSETYVYLNDFLNCNWDEVEFETIVTFNSPTNVSYAYNGTVYSGIAGNYWSDYNET